MYTWSFNDQRLLISYNRSESVFVGVFLCCGSLFLRFKIQALHFRVSLHNIGTIVEGLVETSNVHILRVVVHKHSLLVDFEESCPQSL